MNVFQAIREAFRIIDEVLADLGFMHGPDHVSLQAKGLRWLWLKSSLMKIVWM